MEGIDRAKNIVDDLFHDEKAITQWQWEHLMFIIGLAENNVKNAQMVRFGHDVIQRIRESSSDAEARKIISSHIRSNQ